jgi:hypothetical protein
LLDQQILWHYLTRSSLFHQILFLPPLDLLDVMDSLFLKNVEMHLNEAILVSELEAVADEVYQNLGNSSFVSDHPL